MMLNNYSNSKNNDSYSDQIHDSVASTASATTQTAVPPPPPSPPVLECCRHRVTESPLPWNHKPRSAATFTIPSYCQPAPVSPDEKQQQQQQQRSSNLLLEASDQLAEEYGRELWKYWVCIRGLGNVLLESENHATNGA
jgi:hypothetical protein